jgi:hypothetical protein
MLKYEPTHNNIEEMMPKVALAILKEDYENSMELDPLFIIHKCNESRTN